MSHRGTILRRIAKDTMASIPKDARKVLNGVKLFAGDLGFTADGTKILGMCRSDGRIVVLDEQLLELYAQGSQSLAEETLGHELAHAYRALTGQAAVDDEAEERGARRVAKSWGFRPKRRPISQ